MSIPRATARLQFSRAFTLDDAVAQVPYLAALGISHLYASPLLTARSGSAHGYDIVDHAHINPELGGEPALRRLAAALRTHGLGLVLDIVPNHMAVGGSDNAWWLDVLEWGQHSPWASYFDIDWRSGVPGLRGKVLVPFLGKPYAQCLSDGELVLRFDPADGRLFVAYYHHRFPIAPASCPGLMRPRAELQEVASAFERIGSNPPDRAAAAQARELLRSHAATGEGAAAMQAVLEHANAADAAARQALHALLEQQHYRLCWWRLAAHCINWRRFFDVNDLAALRADRDDVFESTHAVVLRLYAEGLIDGVRVDHVDGLADPGAYCRKLRRRLEGLSGQRPPDAASGPPYIIVEKILAPYEALRTSWRTDGSTGYDFMGQVSAIQHDPDGEAALAALWRELSQRPGNLEHEARSARQELLASTFAGDCESAINELRRIAGTDIAARDIPPAALRRALVALLVHIPVYRFYSWPLDRDDRRVLAMALRSARRGLGPLDRSALRYVARLLAPRGDAIPAGRRLAARLQRLCAPLAAKAVEDTAFYRHGLLLSRNEVGASPSQFALAPADFHAACLQRQRRFPHAMLATATHDHKRGEDVRARLAVFSEVPDAWARAVRGWMMLNAPLRAQLSDGWAPEPTDEYMLYQMIVGAWPTDLRPDDDAGVLAFAERLAGWQQKALREAKQRTSWHDPHPGYEKACRRFLMGVLDGSSLARESLHRFVARIDAAGALNGLAQTLLRLTVPGVPDLYQGTELWDFSLVDPDNRRPVDFDVCRQQLARDADMPALLATWRDGAVKQRLIARTLDLRRRCPHLFSTAAYVALQPEGPAAAHVLGFIRQAGGDALAVLVTRLPLRLRADLDMPLVSTGLWQDTSVTLPEARWQDVFVGDRVLSGGRLALRDVLDRLPVALLRRI